MAMKHCPLLRPGRPKAKSAEDNMHLPGRQEVRSEPRRTVVNALLHGDYVETAAERTMNT